MLEIRKNIVLEGKHGRPVILDYFYPDQRDKMPAVLFCHGYKGYKDWGAWELAAKYFAEAGFFFVKMNFSHNGGTPENPIDFPDLEAFGQNNFLIELDDLGTVLDWLTSNERLGDLIDLERFTLIGHSRGGGISVVKAAEDARIKCLVSWAGLSDFGSRFPSGEILDKWKNDGVAHIENSRTKQMMPHYYQFYTSFKENETRLTISKAANRLRIPVLYIHGTQDETVPVEEAKRLKHWTPGSKLFLLEDGDHSFGSKQPWENEELPTQLHQILVESVDFIRQNQKA